MRKLTTKFFRPMIETLGERIVPSVTIKDGDLKIDCGSGHDVVTVSRVNVPGNASTKAVDVYRIVENGVKTEIPVSKITGGNVVFNGNGGNDRFENLTWLGALATGGDGADTLIGGPGSDYMLGNSHADHLEGNGGSDRLFGNSDVAFDADPSPNYIWGGDGSDYLHGAMGNDRIDGGRGQDYLYGHGGEDWLIAAEGIADDLSNNHLVGGDQNDTLIGGSGRDFLDGGRGSDELYGHGGNDELHAANGNGTDQGADYLAGGAGSDKLYGGTGKDALLGGDDGDTLYGFGGDDYLDGEGGIDYVYGGDGSDELVGGLDAFGNHLDGGANNDTITGGLGSDYLYGMAGHDLLKGNAGNDRLDGGINDDTLHGGDGLDVLIGGTGNDGLFGGMGDGRDTMTGGAGHDRFLMPALASGAAEDVISDRAATDARIVFKNSPAVFNKQFTGRTGTFDFAAGSWTNDDIERVDDGFANLHRHTGNTRLLKPSKGGEMTFLAVGQQLTNLGSTVGGWNGDREIAIVDPAAMSDLDLNRTVYHEYGHEWQNPGENRHVDAFRRISGWGQFDNPPAGYTLSKGGDRWYYFTSAASTFARDYGKTNPFEDMATTWEAYFINIYDGGATALASVPLTAIPAKWANLDLLFADLRKTA